MERKKYLSLITEHDNLYDQACNLINHKFNEKYHAKVERFPKQIVAVVEADRIYREKEITACFSFSCANKGELFSESYLDNKIEEELYRNYNVLVSRDKIIEIGGFASNSKSGSSLQILSCIPWFFIGLGYEYVLNTTTAYVRQMFKKTGLHFNPLKNIAVDNLQQEIVKQWGTYYENDIITGVLDLNTSYFEVAKINQLKSNNDFSSMVKNSFSHILL